MTVAKINVFRFGRRPATLGLMILSLMSTLSGSFCRGFWSYATTRLVTGVAAQVIFLKFEHSWSQILSYIIHLKPK